MDQKNKSQKTETTKATKLSNLASSKYFSIDVTNLARYVKNAPDLGKDYRAATVSLKHDMDLFVEARIRAYNDGRLTVEFWGDRAALTPPLISFIADCSKKFGPSISGATEVTDEDYELLKRGLFNRMWDEACVTMSNNDDDVRVMVLGLFNPPQNAPADLVGLKPVKEKNPLKKKE